MLHPITCFCFLYTRLKIINKINCMKLLCSWSILSECGWNILFIFIFSGNSIDSVSFMHNFKSILFLFLPGMMLNTDRNIIKDMSFWLWTSELVNYAVNQRNKTLLSDRLMVVKVKSEITEPTPRHNLQTNTEKIRKYRPGRKSLQIQTAPQTSSGQKRNYLSISFKETSFIL